MVARSEADASASAASGSNTGDESAGRMRRVDWKKSQEDGMLSFPPTPAYLETGSRTAEAGPQSWWESASQLQNAGYTLALAQGLQSSDPRLRLWSCRGASAMASAFSRAVEAQRFAAGRAVRELERAGAARQEASDAEAGLQQKCVRLYEAAKRVRLLRDQAAHDRDALATSIDQSQEHQPARMLAEAAGRADRARKKYSRAKQRYTESLEAVKQAKAAKERLGMQLVTARAHWESARDALLRAAGWARGLVGECGPLLPSLSQADPSVEVREAAMLAVAAVASLGSRLGSSGLDRQDEGSLAAPVPAGSSHGGATPRNSTGAQGATDGSRGGAASPGRSRPAVLHRSYSRGYIGGALESYHRMLTARGSVDVASPPMGPASTGQMHKQPVPRGGEQQSMSAAARERLIVMSLPASIHATARLIDMLGPLDTLLWWEESSGESPGGESAAVAASAAAHHRAVQEGYVGSHRHSRQSSIHRAPSPRDSPAEDDDDATGIDEGEGHLADGSGVVALADACWPMSCGATTHASLPFPDLCQHWFGTALPSGAWTLAMRIARDGFPE